MKKTFFLLLILFPFFAIAQNDSKAKDVLKKLSDKINSYKSLYIEYTIITENLQDNTRNLQSGKVTAQKNKYKIFSNKDLEIYCDGVTKWTYMKDVQEINIQDVDPKAEDIFTNPVALFTGQRKDFKYFYKGQVEEDGKTLTEIDYNPKNISKAPYSIIRLHLDEKTLIPYSIKYIGKDGMHYTVRLNNYMPNADTSTENFTFDPSKYPNAEVIDLRTTAN